jgi:hypothetical protein
MAWMRTGGDSGGSMRVWFRKDPERTPGSM